MTEKVKNIDGNIVDVNHFTEDTWNDFKNNYTIGNLKMICCGSNAIPKTSINFKKFFAHQNDDCKTAPETIWHILTKKIILEEFLKNNVKAVEEKIGKNWIADIYIEHNNRKIAIEIQHSAQTLRLYIERQERYKSCNIETIWILFQPRYKTISKAIGKYRLKNEFKNIIPEKGFMPSLNNLPVFYFDDQNYRIKGVGQFSETIEKFVKSILKNSLIFEKTWKLN